jgi:hypothetical protein
MVRESLFWCAGASLTGVRLPVLLWLMMLLLLLLWWWALLLLLLLCCWRWLWLLWW